jgi:hypothetical protein
MVFCVGRGPVAQFLSELREKQHRIRHCVLSYVCEEKEKGPLTMGLGRFMLRQGFIGEWGPALRN